MKMIGPQLAHFMAGRHSRASRTPLKTLISDMKMIGPQLARFMAGRHSRASRTPLKTLISKNRVQSASEISSNRGFNFPAHRNLGVSEGVENLLG